MKIEEKIDKYLNENIFSDIVDKKIWGMPKHQIGKTNPVVKKLEKMG